MRARKHTRTPIHTPARAANVHKTADEKNGSAKKRKAETAADLKQRLLESFFYLFFLANFMVVVVMQRDPIYYTGP